MKWLLYLLLAAGVVGCWAFYLKQADSTSSMQQTIEKLKEAGDPKDEVPALTTEMQGIENEKTFTGILLTFLSAGLVGILFVVHVLPLIAQRLTHAVYDSAEIVQRDAMSGARSLLAQGEWEAAIAAFQEASQVDPLNRVPWVEISKIYKDHLEDPQAAIQTLRDALESHEWEVNDAAYFMFRLAELYNEVDGDRATAVAIMNQVIEQFPETRHSANAIHKLREWSLQDTPGEVAEAEASLVDEEAEYLARLRAAEAAEQVAAGEGAFEPEAAAEDEEPPPAQRTV